MSALVRTAFGFDPLAESDAIVENQCLKYYALAASWTAYFSLEDTIKSFSSSPHGDENAFPNAERTKDGIFLVPGLDVTIQKRAACRFAGAVMLSESEECQTDPKKPSLVERSYEHHSSHTKFSLTLLQAREQLFSGQFDSKFGDLKAKNVSLKLFVCVKPGPAEEFSPMHLLWYYQADRPEQLESIWQAPDAKLHPALKLQHPELWHDEERHQLKLPKQAKDAKDTKKDESSAVPAYGYILMHFQAIDKPIEVEYEEEQPLVGSGSSEDDQEADNLAHRLSPAFSVMSCIAVIAAIRSLT